MSIVVPPIRSIEVDSIDGNIEIASFLEATQEYDAQRNCQLVALGAAALIQDGTGRILVFEHEGSPGGIVQGAIGPPTEKLRPLKSQPTHIESPRHMVTRVLREEAGHTDEVIRASNLYFDSLSVVATGEWVLGKKDGVTQYMAGFTVGLSVGNPDILEHMEHRTKEVLDAHFMYIRELTNPAKSGINLRPGVLDWFKKVEQLVCPFEPDDDIIPFEPAQLEATLRDIIIP